MKTNFYVCSWRKVPIYLNITVLLGIGIMTWFLSSSISLPLAISITIAAYISILLHEFGHVFEIQRQGITVNKVLLHGLGGGTLFNPSDMPKRYGSQIKIAIAGPVINVALAILAAGFLFAAKTFAIQALVTFGFWVLLINLAMVAFNLLPIFPLDGGRIYQAFLAMKLGLRRASIWTYYTTVILSLGLLGLGMYIGDPFMIFMAPLFILGAWAEKDRVKEGEGYGSN